MEYGVKHQTSYSRGQLLLRTFFGWLYIYIPHIIVIYFLSLISFFITFIAFWAILFTGKYPEGLYNYQIGLQTWGLRLAARALNLADGYPHFGLTNKDENIKLVLERPEKSNRLTVLLRTFFGFFYVVIPHMFVLMFLMFGLYIINFVAFWAILFTGKYPKSFHDYVNGVLRWQFRVNAYLLYLTDTYPAFSLSEGAANFENNEATA